MAADRGVYICQSQSLNVVQLYTLHAALYFFFLGSEYVSLSFMDSVYTD